VSLQYFVCTGCDFRLHWFVKIEDKFGSSASLMKLACLLERINGPLFVHRKMIVLW